MKKTEDELIEDMLNTAFSEDIGDGDHTTLCCIPDTAMGKAKLLVKEDGVLAGVDIALRVFKKFDPELKVEVLMHDGDTIKRVISYSTLRERLSRFYRQSVWCLT